jgi:hypothetical protein
MIRQTLIQLPSPPPSTSGLVPYPSGGDWVYARVGGTTAQRPVGVPEGWVYFDTEVDGAFQWGGGLWQPLSPATPDFPLPPKVVTSMGRGDSASLDTMGMQRTAEGTETAPALATTNLITRSRWTKKTVSNNTATANIHTSDYTNALAFLCGNGTLGGFKAVFDFAFESAVTNNNRSFTGLWTGAVAPIQTDIPATMLNKIGVGIHSNDLTQLKVFWGGSASQTPIALGTSFPPLDTPYRLTIECLSTQNGVFHLGLRKLGTTTEYTTTLTPVTPGVETPGNTTLMSWVHWLWAQSTGVGGTVTQYTGQFLVETDY